EACGCQRNALRPSPTRSRAAPCRLSRRAAMNHAARTQDGWHILAGQTAFQRPERQSRGDSMKRFIVTLLLTTVSATAWSAGIDWRAKVDPWVLDTSNGGRTTEFLVYLRDQADLRDAVRQPNK